jgi:hypothetical protein
VLLIESPMSLAPGVAGSPAEGSAAWQQGRLQGLSAVPSEVAQSMAVGLARVYQWDRPQETTSGGTSCRSRELHSPARRVSAQGVTHVQRRDSRAA